MNNLPIGRWALGYFTYLALVLRRHYSDFPLTSYWKNAPACTRIDTSSLRMSISQLLIDTLIYHQFILNIEKSSADWQPWSSRKRIRKPFIFRSSDRSLRETGNLERGTWEHQRWLIVSRLWTDIHTVCFIRDTL